MRINLRQVFFVLASLSIAFSIWHGNDLALRNAETFRNKGCMLFYDANTPLNWHILCGGYLAANIKRIALFDFENVESDIIQTPPIKFVDAVVDDDLMIRIRNEYALETVYFNKSKYSKIARIEDKASQPKT